MSGGSSDKELNELAVRPQRVPSVSIVVTTVTPVTNEPSTSRRARRSLGSCVVADEEFIVVLVSENSVSNSNYRSLVMNVKLI